jgi:hypothetical protein
MPPAQSLFLMLNLLSRRADARLQFPLVEHPGKDVTQVGAQVLDAPLAVAGIRRMNYAILPKLLNDVAHLLQASVQQKQAFIEHRVIRGHQSINSCIRTCCMLY